MRDDSRSHFGASRRKDSNERALVPCLTCPAYHSHISIAIAAFSVVAAAAAERGQEGGGRNKNQNYSLPDYFWLWPTTCARGYTGRARRRKPLTTPMMLGHLRSASESLRTTKKSTPRSQHRHHMKRRTAQKIVSGPSPGPTRPSIFLKTRASSYEGQSNLKSTVTGNIIWLNSLLKKGVTLVTSYEIVFG